MFYDAQRREEANIQMHKALSLNINRQKTLRADAKTLWPAIEVGISF
jgi:hypothetical protein